MTDAPERIRVGQDADGFWTCREAVSGSQEYVRADLLTAANAEIARCHRRLEIDAHTDGNGVRVMIPMQDRASFPDGIECRDVTIEGLDAMIDRLRAEVERLRGTLDGFRRALAVLPPGPWKTWASCSFRRITGPDGRDGGVLHALNQPGDGHPDLSWTEIQCEAICAIVNGLRAALSDAASTEGETE